METKLCVIADGYPYKESNHCVFVRELVVELAKQGCECSVVVPQMRMIRGSYLPYHWTEEIDDTVKINVYAPKFLSFTSKPCGMGLTMFNHAHAVQRVLRKEGIVPDLYYGHFIYLNGLTAVALAQKNNKRAYIACGENTKRLLPGAIPYSLGLKYHGWKKRLSKANGIICVSSQNKRLLLSTGFIDATLPTAVMPNGVNGSVFHAGNHAESRKRLGIGEQDFVVAFVGAFIPRKGNTRVDDAVLGLSGIKTIFIGTGDFLPQSDCIYCGAVKHDAIPSYLSAADAFVLPTTGEGCCNAIIEAICCGLPIISSRDRFNDDLLDDSFSIRIDPNDVSEIRAAIVRLRDNPELRQSMHSSALAHAKQFSLTERATRIMKFLARS